MISRWIQILILATGPGPGPGQGPDLPTVECLLLAVANHWSIRELFDRQVELMERFFDQEQMKIVLSKLEVASGLAKHKNRQNGVN